jgi:hypothetical protein
MPQQPNKRDPLTPIDLEERVHLPIVWLIVLGLVGVGIVAHILLAIYSSGGLIVWPFIFAVAVLLIVNDAASQNAAGVPPFQAYALFFGTLLGFFLFVFLVSQTINPWVIVILVIGVSVYLGYDWNKRRAHERELARRRLAGLCIRCLQPVKSGIEDECQNCGMPVNPERLNLFRLGKAISNKAQSTRARQTLTGGGPTKADVKLKNLQQTRAYRYKRGK